MIRLDTPTRTHTAIRGDHLKKKKENKSTEELSEKKPITHNAISAWSIDITQEKKKRKTRNISHRDRKEQKNANYFPEA